MNMKLKGTYGKLDFIFKALINRNRSMRPKTFPRFFDLLKCIAGKIYMEYLNFIRILMLFIEPINLNIILVNLLIIKINVFLKVINLLVWPGLEMS